ncbi:MULTISPECIES: Rha family transcriptional regulator [Lactobacillus]|uniref:Rha family transcriptional regulator n=1 Tax=Lactobacillus TaxID=1578 RepID=UPI000B5D9C37|nr:MULTISPECIES: Rha family transcriptional regulator [Lactobacillus]OXC23177.1 antirepressor [Lactobacillus crispatus]PEG90775.1 phage regulatory protein [Lactobacillus sp. UMNPBX12]PEG92681.1 phage regulatory protein [Lactobacillus sp. UMNPBX11]
MNDLVIMKSRKALTTSLKVAEVFSKNHRDVMRSIKNLTAQNCAVGKMFVESTYVNRQGHEQPMYYMNRDGFTLLAMGFTGRDAMRFKLEYIEAFNQMDELIRNESSLPQTPEEQLQLTMVVTNRLVKRVGKVEARVDHIEKTSELSEIQRYQLLQARKKRVIEAVGGVDSNYYKDTKARKVFNAFGKDFKKEFQIPRYDSLEKQYFEKAMEFTQNWYPDFVLQREIQNSNAQTSLKI